MSDKMHPMSMAHLMEWIFKEYEKNQSIFGVRKMVKYKGGQIISIFGEKLEAPFGPAAGPHTQLAQNIIASYVAGARFFELKTVQILDGAELSACVSKPCILAKDESYNCEWSTELTVEQAYEEYVKAWVICKLLAREYELGDADAFVFNMSVGYDLAGIKSKKIDMYINRMMEAKDTSIFQDCIHWALKHEDCFQHVNKDDILGISSKISSSITVSTLHGCPPDEIRRIARYLMVEKGLHTYVKCNPTLLGYEYSRKTLDQLGFEEVRFDDHHFRGDLQWSDAITMIHDLKKVANSRKLTFGVKLSNTLPVEVTAEELPAKEMYMAGRSLFPLTIHLARLLGEEFKGNLNMSFSGGATIHNMEALIQAGLWPVTMATNLLKPGGYERMSQIGEKFQEYDYKNYQGISLEKLRSIDEDVLGNDLYRKKEQSFAKMQIEKKLPLFDCFHAPCQNGCPIHQDIPAYLAALEEGGSEKALQIILEKNPLPFITGSICPHHCNDVCMRNYYEESLHIRQMKLLAAENGFSKALSRLKKREKVEGKKVAIVGGGPAGLSAAAFLAKKGVSVTVFEKRDLLGGIVRYVIPKFRIAQGMIENDIALCKAYGAAFVTGKEITSLEELKKQGYTDIVLAVGAWKEGKNPLEYGKAMDALPFLAAIKRGEPMKTGKDVIVLGGGNTAIDVARAAKRLEGTEHVRLLYRRTKKYMPADREELEHALKEGVEFMELLSPIGWKDGLMTCRRMKLGSVDAGGRRSVSASQEEVTLKASFVIAAVGERVDSNFFQSLGLSVGVQGFPLLDENLMTEEGIYVIGDAKNGPATVVEAIADAQKVVSAITGCSFDAFEEENIQSDDRKYIDRKGKIVEKMDQAVDRRCLGCASVCQVCEEVCPNRANVAIHVKGKCQAQIIHLDGLCNECGNCAVFCPYVGKPYKDKFTLFWTKEAFENSENEGFVLLANHQMLLRSDGEIYRINEKEIGSISKEIELVVKALMEEYPYLLAGEDDSFEVH